MFGSQIQIPRVQASVVVPTGNFGGVAVVDVVVVDVVVVDVVVVEVVVVESERSELTMRFKRKLFPVR